MEHQVFVPVPVPALRRTLGDPVRVARCVPGLQQDADGSASPLAGRLKFRAGGHTITYRGELKLSGPGAAEGDRFTVTGEGVEARGTGAVKLALTVSLTAADGGTTLTYGGTASGDGRLAELEEGAALTAAQRLLDRFTQQLVTETLAAGEGEDAAPGSTAPGSAEDVSAEGLAGDVEPSADGRDGEGAGAGAGTGSAAEPAEPGSAAGAAGSADAGSAAGTGAAAGASESSSVFDSPVPPPSLDPVAGVEFSVPDEPPAEAAHARRTMIGRSAEEVDHAPPRGRYAPVPSPDSGGAGTTLRWVAPAAALALASAVVLSRALRRRR
ncbi:SRPBCC domain-containing protein [Streptomyces sp. 196(2019)]|uniref:SRPBCC domain-containing protein n=1 Tax=Streptomyces sp. 196(2019) TaxID=2683820 RepID=UPI0013EC7D47|nr:SRPBCC domain-containing protein [Streptomyces sp. 196(2019)]NGO82461.1 carbon monoxide dehydrogenase [Streptomyces sp. 196(2019)]